MEFPYLDDWQAIAIWISVCVVSGSLLLLAFGYTKELTEGVWSKVETTGCCWQQGQHKTRQLPVTIQHYSNSPKQLYNWSRLLHRLLISFGPKFLSCEITRASLISNTLALSVFQVPPSIYIYIYTYAALGFPLQGLRFWVMGFKDLDMEWNPHVLLLFSFFRPSLLFSPPPPLSLSL